MTQALTRHGGPPAVVLRQQTTHGRIAADEARLLGRRRGPGWVREVVLAHGPTPVLVARSVALTPALRRSPALRNLGPRPLGVWLFEGPHPPRSILSQTARLRPGHPLIRQLCLHPDLPRPPSHWARRTVYRVGGGLVLVTELLLPTLWQSQRSLAPQA
jgi:chorismate--pyruvate lyase